MKKQFLLELKDNMSKLDSVYDLAALCYDYLVDRVENPALFIGKYLCENEDAKKNNPNLDKLFQFQQFIKLILCKQSIGYDYTNLQKAIGLIAESMEKDLIPYETNELNKATIPFFILLAIDRYVLERKGDCIGRNPLNRKYNKKSYVYLNVTDSMLDEVVKNKVIKESVICDQIEHLIFLEKRALPSDIKNPPQIVPLYIRDSDTARIKVLDSAKLKIAVIPFGQNKMIDFKVDEGALFHVEYMPGHIGSGAKRALELLNQAIDEKANIIIFPEFVCEKKIQKAIKKELEDIYRVAPERTEALLIVVAGSRWDKGGDNVVDILAYDGRLLGHQYKYAAYSDLEGEDKKWIEGLNHPGKECTFVEIDKLGKIMFGICRDIVAESYIASLAKIFSPQFLLVPAWSRSVRKGFVSQFQRITLKNHRTCSILCNCCEAYNTFSFFKKEVGMLMYPVEKTGYMDVKMKLMSRKEAHCKKECLKGGCAFMIDLDASQANIKNGCISAKIEQKFNN